MTNAPIERDGPSENGEPDKTAKPTKQGGNPFNWRALVLSVIFGVVLIITLLNIDWGSLKPSSSTKTPPASTQYPVCLGAENSSITFKRGETKKVVKPQGHCWSEWVITPPGSAWRVDAKEGGWAENLFVDGSIYGIAFGKPYDVGVRRGIFRIRGADSVIVTVSGKS